MKKSPDKFTHEEAQQLTAELKECWHELGQLHLRLYNGVDRHEPIYLTKPQVKNALSTLCKKIDDISKKYIADQKKI